MAMTLSGRLQRIRDLRSDIADLVTQEFRLKCRLSELVSQRETLELTLKAVEEYSQVLPDPPAGQSAEVKV